MKKGLKIITIIVALLFAALLGRYFSSQQPDNTLKNSSEKKPMFWIDPMEPQVHYPGPGKSRMNMELVPIYPESVDKNEQPNTVRISPAVINNLGIRTTLVEKGNLARQIDTVGYVEPNENKISHIHTYVDGWIKKLTVKTTGEKVKKGQLLFQLYSPMLVNAQQEYLLALESRNKELIEASRLKLQALRISDIQIEQIKRTRQSNQLVDIFSPQDGFVVALNVREGMRVVPENEVMGIVDLSSVWMIAEVFEQQAGWVSVGQEAYAKLPAFPAKIWKGRVEYVYPEVEQATRTLKVRFLFDNPEFILKPNMYANITLLVNPKLDTLNIPIEALIRSSQGNRVIVALGQGRFQVRPVTTGIETNERVEILSGLKQGEQVVTSGQFLIDSEANLRGSMQRMESSSASERKTQ